jgi:hypothetical protein
LLALPARFLFFDARRHFRFPNAPLAILVSFGVSEGSFCLLISLPQIRELFAARTKFRIESRNLFGGSLNLFFGFACFVSRVSGFLPDVCLALGRFVSLLFQG